MSRFGSFDLRPVRKRTLADNAKGAHHPEMPCIQTVIDLSILEHGTYSGSVGMERDETREQMIDTELMDERRIAED